MDEPVQLPVVPESRGERARPTDDVPRWRGTRRVACGVRRRAIRLFVF
jgi:hypothetical protein